MAASGDFESMMPMFEYYVAQLPLAELRTQRWYGHAGAFFPETSYMWGSYMPASERLPADACSAVLAPLPSDSAPSLCQTTDATDLCTRAGLARERLPSRPPFPTRWSACQTYGECCCSNARKPGSSDPPPLIPGTTTRRDSSCRHLCSSTTLTRMTKPLPSACCCRP